MRIVARSTLKAFVANRVEYKDREIVLGQLDSWYKLALHANWSNSADVKAALGSASIVTSVRVVFNIKGNDYRLVAALDYLRHGITVLWIGTHKEYDRIDVRKVEYDRSRYFGSRDRD